MASRCLDPKRSAMTADAEALPPATGLAVGCATFPSSSRARTFSMPPKESDSTDCGDSDAATLSKTSSASQP